MRTMIPIQSSEDAYPYSVRDVHISDPCILADEASGLYYTYAQFVDSQRFPGAAVDEPAIYCISSPDLVNWSVPKACFRKGGFWADLDYWAPEIHIYRGRYILIATFRASGTYRRCQCLASDRPDGPFEPIGEPLTPEGWQCLDGTLYVDGKGQPWLVFAHEWLQVYDGQVCAVRLAEDLHCAIGEPEILFRASEGPWVGKAVRGGGNVTDGPFLYRMQSGRLILLWSSFAENGAYITGYAWSRSGDIHGPWVQESQPLYGLDGGHSMLFRTFSGQLMMTLHCPNDHMKKRMMLFEMEEKGDRLQVINEVTGNWCTELGGNAVPWRFRAPISGGVWFSSDPRKQA